MALVHQCHQRKLVKLSVSLSCRLSAEYCRARCSGPSFVCPFSYFLSSMTLNSDLDPLPLNWVPRKQGTVGCAARLIVLH